jgi:hypothetical protein
MMFWNPSLAGVMLFAAIIAPLAGVRAQQPEFAPLPVIQSKNITPDCPGYAADQQHPSIASDGKGNVAIVWEDARNGNTDVYLQCYAAGVMVGPNRKVNMTPVWITGSANAHSGAVVDVNANGSGVIVWIRNEVELRARPFDLATAALGDELPLDVGLDTSGFGTISVQVFSDASFIVGRSPRASDVGTPRFMQYRLFSSTGTAISEVHSLQGYGSTLGQAAILHALPDGRAVAVLSRGRSDSTAVVLAFIEKDGEPCPETLEVFPPLPTIGDHFLDVPSAKVNHLGQLLIARRHGFHQGEIDRQFIEWRQVDCRHGTATPIQSLEVGYGSRLQALGDTGMGFQLYWTDPNPDHAIARIDGAGSLLDIRRFDCEFPGPARFQLGDPHMLQDPVAGLLAVWTVVSGESFTVRTSQLRLTRIVGESPTVEDLGAVSDDTCGASQLTPSLCGNGAGRYLACWQSAPAGISVLQCQVLDERLDPVGPMSSPNLEMESEYSGIHDVAPMPDGSFLLVYRSVNPRGNAGLFLDRIDSDGVLRGKPVCLDDTTQSNLPLTLACGKDGMVHLGYYDIGDPTAPVTLVRLTWNGEEGPSRASRSTWPLIWFHETIQRTIAALDINARGDVLHASYRLMYDGGLYIRDFHATVYSSDGAVDTALTIPTSAMLDAENDWYLLKCAISEERDIALCWTEMRYFGDRCAGEDQWYDEPSLQLLRAHAETGWRPWLESFPLRTDDTPAVTLQWPDSGGPLCTWSVADSCKAVRYDDCLRRRETMALHLSTPQELPALDVHRAHSVVMEERRFHFLFESNVEAGHGYDVHGKVLAFGETGADRSLAFSFELFPSPAMHHVTARFVLPKASRVVVRIFDLLGRELRRRDAGILEEGGHFLALPIDGLASGTYLVGLTAQEQHFRSMVILPAR